MVNSFNTCYVFISGSCSAWFHNFHSAWDLIRRLGVEDNFQRWEVHDVVYRNYKPERMYSHGIFPLNLAGRSVFAPKLKKKPNIAQNSTSGMLTLSAVFAYQLLTMQIS